MTLILTAANVTGVCQSSDYQLVDQKTGAPVGDRAGSKQLQAGFKEFDIRLAFTGVAVVGAGRRAERTLEWLSSELKLLPHEATLDQVCEALSRTCAEKVKHLGQRGVLELVFTVGAPAKLFRVATISNVNWSKRPPCAKPGFSTRIRTITGPFHLISGYRDCVPALQRQRLRAAARNIGPSSPQVLDTLADINAIAAKNSRGWVSESCWVTSQMSDGTLDRSATRNVGKQPGTVPHIIAGIDISEWIKNNFRAAPGKEITFVQGAGVKTGPGGGTPMPAPTGEPRIFKFSGASISVPLSSSTGERSAFIDIAQEIDAVAELRLNQEVLVTFARINLSAVHPLSKPFPRPLYPWPHVSPGLVIDGIEIPRGWEYSVGYWIEANSHHVVVPPSSRGIRNLPFLGPQEEMVIVAPTEVLDFTWVHGEKPPTAIVQARIGWRSRLDATIG